LPALAPSAVVNARALDWSTADDLCRSLPRQDPIAAQQALCEALSRPFTETEGGGRLATLSALDGAARQTCERLLDRYVEGDAQLRLLDRRTYVSASRLSQSMSEAYERLLPRAGVPRAPVSAAEVAPVVARLLVFRQIEFLLRMFRYKRRNANRWRALHETYLSAIGWGAERHGVSLGSPESSSGSSTTPERQYIQILLLEATNAGQLSPREALWTYRWLAHGCASLRLRPDQGAEVSTGPCGFAIDLGGGEGPTRKAIPTSETVLYLDTGPLIATIDAELAEKRDSTATRDPPPSGTRRAEMALLAKLRILLDPAPTRIERRGERAPMDSGVHVLAGLPHIIHALRTVASTPSGRGAAAAPLDESTIGAFGGATRTRTLAAWDSAEFARGTVPETWQIRDRSDSGCRLRGKTADLNSVIPGSLFAMRTSETAPWTVGVVRRLRRLMVDHVEVGVEYLGCKPRFVKIVIEQVFDPSVGPGREVEAKCIGALYLPPSRELPAMPIRTLLLPTREFRPNGEVTLLSSNATYKLRLDDPIQRQMDFVWTPFTVMEKNAR
jgi:hypothetical protein